MEDIHVLDCPEFTDVGVDVLAANCCLRNVRFEKCENITINAIVSLAKYRHDDTSLNVTLLFCNQITNNDVLAFNVKTPVNPCGKTSVNPCGKTSVNPCGNQLSLDQRNVVIIFFDDEGAYQIYRGYEQ